MATFTVYGDSHTSYQKASLEEALQSNGCWVNYATSPGLTLVGGWVKSGATSEDALANVYYQHSDICVVMLGTNDVTDNFPVEKTLANIRAIGEGSGAERVLVLANPPRSGGRADSQVALNESIRSRFRGREGWDFYDPWVVQRAADGQWSKSSYTVDGLHATRGVYEYMGTEMGERIPFVLQVPNRLPASRHDVLVLQDRIEHLEAVLSTLKVCSCSCTSP